MPTGKIVSPPSFDPSPDVNHEKREHKQEIDKNLVCGYMVEVAGPRPGEKELDDHKKGKIVFVRKTDNIAYSVNDPIEYDYVDAKTSKIGIGKNLHHSS
jgi:hypothetical protein